MRSQYKKDIIDARCIILCSTAPSIEPDQSVFFLEDHDDGESLRFTEFVYDFMSSLFVILESKRIEKVNEKLEYMALPTAPIEQEQDGSESGSKYVQFLTSRNKQKNKTLVAYIYLKSFPDLCNFMGNNILISFHELFSLINYIS